MPDFSALTPYVTNLDRPIFALRNLPEEVVAVLFAYYSRSREDLRANLLKLLEERDLDMVAVPLQSGGPEADEAELAHAREKARQFHEKWVVGYGHASVAEHAVAHVAIEDVSILVSKAIEDHRLASYTEKSTRYVVFEANRFHRPELPDPALQAEYDGAVAHLFRVYGELMPQVEARVRESADRSRYQTERGFAAACRAQACDLLRYLLPAATFTNLGLTANARVLAHMIAKLRANPLAEARGVGEAVQREAQQVIPTLIKYAEPSDYRRDTPAAIGKLAEELGVGGWELGVGEGAATAAHSPLARLLRWPAAAEAELAAAVLYEQSGLPWERVRGRAAELSPEAVERVVEEYLSRRGDWDAPLRCLEHLPCLAEITVDYGAYRDIQRHRLCTQTDQLLGVQLGYELPAPLAEFGFGGEFEGAMERAAAAYESLKAYDPRLAQYVVPLAYRKRLLVSWNLRELFHFVELRSKRQGHLAYRRVAWELARELERVSPFLRRFLRVDTEDYGLARPG